MNDHLKTDGNLLKSARKVIDMEWKAVINKTYSLEQIVKAHV